MRKVLIFSFGVHLVLLTVLSLYVCPWLEEKYTFDRVANIDMSILIVDDAGAGVLKPRPRKQKTEIVKRKKKAVAKQIASSESTVSAIEKVEAVEEPYSIQPAGAKDAVRVNSRGYMNWVVNQNEPPFYPRLARIRGEEGTVVIRVRIRQDGSLAGDPELVESSGSDLLDSVSMDTVTSWSYPKFLSKKAEVSFLIPFNFALNP